jgi:splicing factor 3B subunit 1
MSDGKSLRSSPHAQLLMTTAAEIEAVRRLQAERNAAAAAKKGSKTFDPSSQRTDVSTKASLTETFDTTLYEREGSDKYAGYHTSIPVDGEDEDMPDADQGHRLVGQYTATRDQIDEMAHGNGVEEEDILLGREKSARIADR